MKVDCPKCESKLAWYQIDAQDVTLRCMCGYNKVVQTKLEQITIIHSDKEEDIRLPQKNTKIHNCMIALRCIEPATSLQVTNFINETHPSDKKQTVDEVSSQLTVLRYKGIVTPITLKKGVVGGSTWVLTATAKIKIGEY